MSSPSPHEPSRREAPRHDLAHMRHELRTPINHILGYCELLMEEGQLPSGFQGDLQRIHTGGRQLQSLISEYLDEDRFFQPRDWQALYHELRTPVNHIIGYSELLTEQAADLELTDPVRDLKKIHAAAGHWLALMEGFLIEIPEVAAEASATGPGAGSQASISVATAPEADDYGVLLVVDDDEANREVLARRLRRSGYTVATAPDGMQALSAVKNQAFDLVLLDLIMPGCDGFQVLAHMKAEAGLRDIPVLMLSGLDEENGIARCIEMGAEDYLYKPFNPIFLRARIGACLDKKRLRDKERAMHEALAVSQRKLMANLAEAAAYVCTILPPPCADGAIRTDWRYIPSAQLGGDILGYQWIDDEHFAIYVVDVCGHGLTAAFLSISVFNTLRSETLPDTDFRDPAAVLASLNGRFPMHEQNNMYFTIWYGVFNRATRVLTFARGGHPPAVLFAGDGVKELSAPGGIVGFFPETEFHNASVPVPIGSKLYVFSDGAFELPAPGGGTLQTRDLIEQLRAAHPEARLEAALNWARAVNVAPDFEDDLTLLEISL